MERTTITLILDGRPTLADYATALASFNDLVRTSSNNADITWEIEDLGVSSAITTAAAIAETPDVLAEATRQLMDVGRALRDRGQVADARFAGAAAKLVGLLNGRVSSLRLETAEDEVTITELPVVIPLAQPAQFDPSLGGVEGRIQTLSSRGSLRFTLYDLVFDKAVSCYLQPGQEDMMRDAWGRLALIEGLISRDPLIGRPTTVRRVTNVTLRPDGEPGAWRRAAGALRGMGRDEAPEATIRRLRNAQ